VQSSETKKPKKYKARATKTPEQKQAAVERLAAAREKRLRENPPEYKNIHPNVLALDNEHEWSVFNVKKYIKHQKTILAKQQRDFKRGGETSQAQVISTHSYIMNMETYLKTGIWLDRYWGEERDQEVVYVCEALSYYHEGRKKGLAKRTPGVFYRDIGLVYDIDMGNH
jgi:hypothetical protein